MRDNDKFVINPLLASFRGMRYNEQNDAYEEMP